MILSFRSIFVVSIPLLIWGLLLGSSHNMGYAQTAEAQEYLDAVSWMYDKDLTRYNDPTEFRPADTLTREQAAKFFWNFAVYMEKEETKTADECQFNDIANADYTLVDHIWSSCRMWIFKWSQWRFMPFDPITRAEAMTVVVRTISWFEDEYLDPRWYNYHKTARQLGLTDEDDVYSLDTPITRYEIALILYRASRYKEDTTSTQHNASLREQDTRAQMGELRDLLMTLGIQES